MAKQMVFLKYTFLFDAVNTWQHLSQFEDALANFFAAHELEAEILKTVEGQMGERIMLIRAVDLFTKAGQKNIPKKQMGIQKKLQELRPKKKGK
mgnify:FL=1